MRCLCQSFVILLDNLKCLHTLGLLPLLLAPTGCTRRRRVDNSLPLQPTTNYQCYWCNGIALALGATGKPCKPGEQTINQSALDGCESVGSKSWLGLAWLSRALAVFVCLPIDEAFLSDRNLAINACLRVLLFQIPRCRLKFVCGQK